MIDDAKTVERVKEAIWEKFQMWHDGLAETVIAAHKAALAEAGYMIVPRSFRDDRGPVDDSPEAMDHAYGLCPGLSVRR